MDGHPHLELNTYLPYTTSAPQESQETWWLEVTQMTILYTSLQVIAILVVISVIILAIRRGSEVAGYFFAWFGSAHSGVPEVLSITWRDPEIPADSPQPEPRPPVEDSPDASRPTVAAATRTRGKTRTLPAFRHTTPNISGSETLLLNGSKAMHVSRWNAKVPRWLSAPMLGHGSGAAAESVTRNMLLPPLLRDDEADFSFFCLDHDGHYTHFSQPNQDSEDETGHCSHFNKSREEVEAGCGFYIHFSQPQPQEDEEEAITHFGHFQEDGEVTGQCTHVKQPQEDEGNKDEQSTSFNQLQERHYITIGQSQEDSGDEGEQRTYFNQPQDSEEEGHYTRIGQTQERVKEGGHYTPFGKPQESDAKEVGSSLISVL